MPCLCTSWSHKYPLLLEEYGCKDALLRSDDQDTAFAMLRDYINPAINTSIRSQLLGAGAPIKQRVAAMWDEVFALI